MTEFITDDCENKTFIHEGWVVRIWSKQSGINTRTDIESPKEKLERFVEAMRGY